MTKSIESKLPDALKKEWFLYAAERSSTDPEKRFDYLLAFLKSQESIYEQLDQLRDEEPLRKENRPEQRQARTRAKTSQVAISQDVSSVETSSIRRSCTSAKGSVCSSSQRRRTQCGSWEPAGNVWRSMTREIFFLCRNPDCGERTAESHRPSLLSVSQC